MPVFDFQKYICNKRKNWLKKQEILYEIEQDKELFRRNRAKKKAP